MKKDLFGNLLARKNKISREEAAAILKTVPEALEAFEAAYREQALNTDSSDNLFDLDASAIRNAMKKEEGLPDKDTVQKKDRIVNRIAEELLSETRVLSYDGKSLSVQEFPVTSLDPVSREEILSLPEQFRPQLTGTLMKHDLGGEPSYLALLEMWKMYKTEKTPKKRKMAYHLFRQGLDILDLDPVLYEILGTNPNSIGFWFPVLAEAVIRQDFFRIPETKILKVPISMLQLTRLDFGLLTPATLEVVDRFCHTAFGLDDKKEYFVRTGTYSSKYDFRNAHVHGEKEVRELGEYLLFIQNQACMAAGPLCSPCIYGMSTTNEWCVREFIPDKERNLCIYKGLPLHTEYRVFADFDTDEILGISPYWDPDIMKQRFGHEKDSGSIHNIHDYTTFLAHEDILMERYQKNKDKVLEHMEQLVRDINLPGQWSIDIMQNGDDFWIIDMALAANSALKEYIPEGKLKPVEENWIPDLGGGEYIGKKERNAGN